MTNTKHLKWFLIISPFLVLMLTKAGILFSINYFRPEISWIPSFLGYYISILLMFFIAIKYLALPIKQFFTISFKPVPKFGLLFLGIIIPALLPLAAFIPNIKNVPINFIFFILIFSCINPIFEEGFWRGLMNFLPGSNAFRILYTSLLFSFSHLFFWSYWFKVPMIIIPTVISTFIMGILWMWFMQKQKNLLYPVLSHVLVDIFNLSVAVYSGVITFSHY